jgi:hypothetical protein
MNQKIVNYLKENKDKYSKEVLFSELSKVGYSEREILESGNFVYDEKSGRNFWDFTSKKYYRDSSEKLKDFLLGFFAPFILGFVGFFIFSFFSFLLFFFEIFFAAYLFNKRRFISYGIIGNFFFGFATIFFIFLMLFRAF